MALSREDKKYIREHYLLQTHDEMAGIINCTPASIGAYCARYNLVKSADIKKDTARPKGPAPEPKTFEMMLQPEQILFAQKELKASPIFDQLKMQFSHDEINKFIDTWAHYYVQFKGEITPTEKTQIVSAIQYEILMSRSLIMKKDLINTVDKLKKMVDAENLLGDNRDIGKILDLEREISSNISLQTQLTREFNDANARHSNIFKDLKVTRDQRIKDVANITQDFFSLVKELLKRDTQLRDARYMELGRLAAEKEKQRFMELHTFQDGSIDSIMYTPETVLLEEQRKCQEHQSSPE